MLGTNRWGHILKPPGGCSKALSQKGPWVLQLCCTSKRSCPAFCILLTQTVSWANRNAHRYDIKNDLANASICLHLPTHYRWLHNYPRWNITAGRCTHTICTAPPVLPPFPRHAGHSCCCEAAGLAHPAIFWALFLDEKFRICMTFVFLTFLKVCIWKQKATGLRVSDCSFLYSGKIMDVVAVCSDITTRKRWLCDIRREKASCFEEEVSLLLRTSSASRWTRLILAWTSSQALSSTSKLKILQWAKSHPLKDKYISESS